MLERPNNVKIRPVSEWATAAFLFFATAAIVAWQNSRLGVLWDLSYILENSFRISAGDVPYRDFPFPYAPFTFLIQAMIIKTTGAVFWHHILYCAIIGGLGTVLTWKIIQNLLGLIPKARLIAFLLSLPLIILGVYCIYPHPFYDPDCTFVILICVLLLLHLDEKNFPPLRAFFTGISLVVPMFVKQNTGLAFLGSSLVALFVLIGVGIRQKTSVRGYVALIGGVVVGIALALLIIQFTAGLTNYYHWTVIFAAERRTPSASDMLSVYQDWNLALWLVLFAVGAILLWLNRKKKLRLPAVISASFISAPFLWSVCYLFFDSDSSERAERLVVVYPFVLIASFVFSALTARRQNGIRLILPFVLISTIHGAFLSQQLWGSTYALWSLLLILIAITVKAFVELFEISNAQSLVATSGAIALTLIISGGFAVYSNERLDYANPSDGELAHSKLPQLKGLSVHGDWITDFEELVDYTDREIPREDAILMLPGEDLFYYTTGRKPQFPVLMFDHTVNPYSSDEILEQARLRDIRWLIIKNDLQIDEDPLEDRDHLIELLEQDFKHIDSLNNYEIYRRRQPGDEEDDKDDNDEPDDGSDSDDSSSN